MSGAESPTAGGAFRGWRAGRQVWFNAQALFTRLPCPSGIEYTGVHRRRALYCWPLTGWLVGLLAAAAYLTALSLWPPPVAVLLSLAVALWLTGGMHEDGFADFCDGLGAGEPSRALQIMRDPHAGVFALLGLGLLLLAKFVLLAEILPRLTPGQALALYCSAQALSRHAALTPVLMLDYLGGGRGHSAAYLTRPRAGAYGFAAACGLTPLLAWPLLGLGPLLLAAVPVAVAALAFSLWLRRRLGGYNGDCLGAAQQLAELVYYLALCALLPGA